MRVYSVELRGRVGTCSLMRYLIEIAVSTILRHLRELLPTHIAMLHAWEAWNSWHAVHAWQPWRRHCVHGAQLSHVAGSCETVVVVLERLPISELLLLGIDAMRSAGHCVWHLHS